MLYNWIIKIKYILKIINETQKNGKQISNTIQEVGGKEDK